MERFYRRGRVDRERANEYSFKKKYDLKPRSEIEKELSDLHVQAQQIDGDNYVELANIYLNARNIRHDLWVNMLQACRAHEDFNFNDIQVTDFVIGLRNVHRLEINPPPANAAYKTPDILCYNDIDRVIYIGDVAVSKSVQAASQRKYEKYYHIKRYFEENGQNVIQLNLIIDESLNNVSEAVKSIEDTGLINTDMDILNRVRHYHKWANSLMDKTRNMSTLKSQFDNYIDRLDRGDDREPHIEWNVPELDMPDKDEPVLQEDDIIKMVKDITEQNLGTYYDTSYEDAQRKFDELYENFSRRPQMTAKSTLKVVFNTKYIEEKSGHELLRDYIEDIPFSDDESISNYLSNFLPKRGQLAAMSNKDYDFKSQDAKDKRVYGAWQYGRIIEYKDSFITANVVSKLSYGKKNKNAKKEPRTVDVSTYSNCISIMDNMMMQLGEKSDKEPFIPDEWDAKTNSEMANTMKEKAAFDYSKSTCASQLGQALSMLYNRVTHVRANLSTKDNVFVPPNGAFIAIIPREHQPFSDSKCDIPLIFITRYKLSDRPLTFEYEYSFTTPTYRYFVSKLCRLDIDKIANWDQAGHRITAVGSQVISTCNALAVTKELTIGILTVLMLDVHQKTSELLDLLKYISFMPFADLSRVSTLIEDKFDLMLKTALDVWVLKRIEDFMKRLAAPGGVVGTKDKLKVFNGKVMESSLGMKITIPSFCSKVSKHDKIQDFIEEISILNTVRGKQYYGSQFMDKAMHATAKFTKDYYNEIEMYGNWVVDGTGVGPFPFNSDYAFCKDAILYAMKYSEEEVHIRESKVSTKLASLDYNSFPHYNCSLRGCLKEKTWRKNQRDLHTTSMDACLTVYQHLGYDDSKCVSPTMALTYLKDDYMPQYCMSEKMQRGGGRPIATPTLYTKIGNMMIEKPEQAIGTFVPNNIIVSGKHKLREQSKVFKELLEEGIAKKGKEVYQCTEDQKKFSEQDNTRKYLPYIINNSRLPRVIRAMQYQCIKKMECREHLVKRMPMSIMNDPELRRHINSEGNGVRTNIGWPQGMLNNISTSIHSMADIWITRAYNIAYPGRGVQVRGLVHSDDSWYAISCDSLEDFRRFSIFRAFAKRLFCLKINDKKLWGSRLVGELVSNFNINGDVLISIGKTIANGMTNLLYQNWVLDVTSQISTIQQAYRQGATLGTCIMLSTILRNQIIDAYGLRGKEGPYFHRLPIELGGYPNCSVFELGVTGINAHYRYILEDIMRNPDGVLGTVVRRAMRLSLIYNVKKQEMDVQRFVRSRVDLSAYHDLENAANTVDYENVTVPLRGEVFSCVKMIMPKCKKVRETVKKLKAIPFQGSGMELVLTKPKDLATALGNLKDRTSTMIYELASEKYTGSKRRLAVAQSIQATGKTVRIAGYCPMTMREALRFIEEMEGVELSSVDKLQVAFEDDTEMVEICNNIVYKSTLDATLSTKKKVVNNMPSFESKFTTIIPIREVLLNMVDKRLHTSYLTTYKSGTIHEEILMSDTELMERRFATIINYYEIKYACNLIMQQYISRVRPRLWTQPVLRNDDLINFLCDLYGKTLNSSMNYIVDIDYSMNVVGRADANIVDSIYTCAVLNNLYQNKFVINSIADKTIQESLEEIDYSTLNHSTYLKFGILNKMYRDSDYFLADYDSKKMYTQYYIKAQELVNGAYVGKFDVMIRYGRLVMRIEGEPENVSISVNKNSVSEILQAMMIYVNRDHKKYSYKRASSWYMNKFWTDNNLFSPQRLVAYGPNSTFIKTSFVNEKGIGLSTIPYMAYVGDEYENVDGTYSIEKNLREVFKTTEFSKIRIGSVKQDMSCVLADSIVLEPEIIDGFHNNDLLRTKVILHITMRRTFNLNNIEVKKLLTDRLPGPDMRQVALAFLRLCSLFRRDLVMNLPELTAEVDIEVIDIDQVSPETFIDIAQETSPEDLEAIDVEFAEEEIEKIGSMVKYNNLLRMFCSFVSPRMTSFEESDFIYSLITDENFITCIRQMKEEGQVEGDEIIEACAGMPISLGLYCFIISNRLDLDMGWAGEMIEELTRYTDHVPTNPNTVSLAREFIRNVCDIMGVEDRRTLRELVSELFS